MNISIEVLKTDSDVDHFQINSGIISLGRFDFEGARIQAEDVEFEDDFESPILLNIADGTLSQALWYDIPQGTYSEIDTELRVKDEDDDYSLVLEGTFWDDSGDAVPVRFESEGSMDIELSVRYPNGGSEVNFVEGNSKNARIRLHVIDWFRNISESIFEDAEQTEISGTETILISDDENSSLYNAVMNQIGQRDEFIFD